MPTCTITVDRSIKGYTTTCTSGTFTVGESRTLRIIFSEYYSAKVPPFLRIYKNTYGTEKLIDYAYTKVSDKEWILTTSFNPDGNRDYKGIIAIATDGVQSYGKIINHIENCETDCKDGLYIPGNTTINITCNPNFEFLSTPNVRFGVVGNETTLDFTKISDVQYSITFNLSSSRAYGVYAQAAKRSAVTDKYGMIAAYKVTKEELKLLSARRWVKLNPKKIEEQGVILYQLYTEEYLDTAKYVTNLLKLYVDIESDTREEIRFGPYSTGVEGDLIPTDIVTLNFGTVQLNGTHGNALDYKGTDIEIYLPFIGFVPLNVNDFMDKEITLKYQVNTLNGDSLVILEADGNPMFTQNCNVSFSVPFHLAFGEYVDNSLDTNTTRIEGEPPFIYVKSAIATTPDDNIPYRDTKFYAKFGDLHGYTEATEIDMTILPEHTFITKTEIDEIVSLLESGVFL